MAKLDFYATKCLLVEQLAQLSRKTVLKFAEWLVEAGKAFSKNILKVSPELSASDTTRQGYVTLMEVITHSFVMALYYQVNSGRIDGENVDQPGEIQQLATKTGPLACSRAIRGVSRAQKRLQANVNPTLIFESLLLEYLK